MSNIRDKRRTNSRALNEEPTALTSNFERNRRNRVNPPFLVIFCQPKLMKKALQESGGCLEPGLESDTEDFTFKPITAQDSAPAVCSFISNPSIAREIRNELRKMAQKELKRIFAEEADPSMQKAAEEVLLYTFFLGFKNANTGVKNAMN